MDDDVKQLKESMEKYCAYAIEHLFAPGQRPLIEGLTEQDEAELGEGRCRRSLLETHFVFPNICANYRRVLALFQLINHEFNTVMRSSVERARTRPLKWETLVNQMEQRVCECKRMYESQIRQELVDLQRRYVEQVLLAVEVPQ